MRVSRRFIAVIILTLCAPLIDTNAWLFALQNKIGSQPLQEESKPVNDQSSDLTSEIRQLTKAIQELHTSQRRMLDVMLVQIEQGRAEKLENKLSALEAQVSALDAQQALLEWRLNHIENELVTRNIINRLEGEKAVRAELENQLDQVRANRERFEAERQRVSQQVEEVNHRLDLIRERLGPEGESAPEKTPSTEPQKQ